LHALGSAPASTVGFIASQLRRSDVYSHACLVSPLYQGFGIIVNWKRGEIRWRKCGGICWLRRHRIILHSQRSVSYGLGALRKPMARWTC